MGSLTFPATLGADRDDDGVNRIEVVELGGGEVVGGHPLDEGGGGEGVAVGADVDRAADEGFFEKAAGGEKPAAKKAAPAKSKGESPSTKNAAPAKGAAKKAPKAK